MIVTFLFEIPGQSLHVRNRYLRYSKTNHFRLFSTIGHFGAEKYSEFSLPIHIMSTKVSILHEVSLTPGKPFNLTRARPWFQFLSKSDIEFKKESIHDHLIHSYDLSTLFLLMYSPTFYVREV